MDKGKPRETKLSYSSLGFPIYGKYKYMEDTRANRLGKLLEEVEELNTSHGFCLSLIYDDFGNWALATDGVQVSTEKPEETIFITDDPNMWKPTIEEAMRYILDKIMIETGN